MTTVCMCLINKNFQPYLSFFYKQLHFSPYSSYWMHQTPVGQIQQHMENDLKNDLTVYKVFFKGY